MTPNLFNTHEEPSVPEIQFAAFELTDEELALVDGGSNNDVQEVMEGGGGGHGHRGGHRHGGHRHRGGHSHRGGHHRR